MKRATTIGSTLLAACVACVSLEAAAFADNFATSRTFIEVRSGHTLSGILAAQGLSGNALMRALMPVDEAWRLEQLQPGQRLDLLRDHEGRLLEIALRVGGEHTFRFARTDDGFALQREKIAYQRHTASVQGTIVTSLYNAARDAGLSNRVILTLAGVFEWDLDLARDLRVGDRFSVIHEELYLDGRKVRDGEILAAELVSRGRRIRAVRYEDPSGHVAYYTPEGRSVQKAFLRAPIEFARVSSGFSRARHHPVLHTIRAHGGTDYAVATGTPIRATGDGRVVRIDLDGGYGNTVVLAHGGQYTTMYAHMLRFAKGLRAGTRVKQGQVIGYVGQSGVATGPHLHYEFRVRGVPQDPLTVPLPRGVPLPHEYRDEFIAQTQQLTL